MGKVPKRVAGIRRRTLIMTAMALMVPCAALGAASPALASNSYEKYFSQCPINFPGAEYCLYGTTTSGEVAIGKTKVPIEKEIIQQGGALPIGGENYVVLPALNGESLSKAEQNVPGGLLDFINCKEIKGEGFFEKGERAVCESIFENKFTGVTATTESVGNEANPPILNFDNLFGESGTALTLPIRVHLKNPLLGESCYIGSEANPIELHLSTAPPKGKVGNLGEEENGGILVAKEVTFVDTKFSVPTAEGCGGFFSFLIDPVVNGKLGLPSKEGNNVAILTGEQKLSSVETVKKHI
jgi:hypothetical protein